MPDRSVRRSARAGSPPAIECAVREAAGLDAVLDEEHAELLRFVSRMTAAAERRDLPDADGGVGAAFPPLKRRIRPVDPGPRRQALAGALPGALGAARRRGNGRHGRGGGVRHRQ